MSAVRSQNVEHSLDYGAKPDYGNEPGYGAKPDYGNEPDYKPQEETHGLIPKEYRPLVWMCLIGFFVTFLADFAARGAWEAYAAHLATTGTTPVCSNFELMFYVNITMGVVYGIVSLLLLIPGCDKMFYSLYWKPETFPESKTMGRAIIRQMALLLLGINIAQCVAPSNTGVGVVALCINVMVTWNFVLVSCFDHYSGVRYWNMGGLSIRMADFYFVSSIVMTALFAVGLRRTNAFMGQWKDDAQHEQTWLFYLNCFCGINYMIVGILNVLPIYNQWFMSFYFVDMYKARSPVAFFARNGACLIMGMAAASLIAPGNPGVGIVYFFVHVLLVFFFLAAFCGVHGEIKNKPLWVMWLLSAVLFSVLYGYSLSRLDNCAADDTTCGTYRNWMDQPWNTYKNGGADDSKWAGCGN